VERGAHHTDTDHPGDEQQAIIDVGARYFLIENSTEN